MSDTARRIWNNPGTWTQKQDTAYQYDKRNRLKKLIRPSTEEWTFSYNAQNRTGWTDPLGTTVVDSHDDRNLITQRLIERGTGVLGVTKEIYEYDGMGRLTRGANYEEISSVDELHVDTQWEYNTLSLPEKHYQEMDDGWAKTHSSTTYATYDATGFNTGHTYHSGRGITYNRDSLNRVASIVDNTFSRTEATFYYAGRNRLIRRDMFNGTKMIVQYEDSGCGCGGFTALVESVRHEGPLGQTLYREERRYDVNANVTAQRWEHLGNVGNVYRYDATYRMTDEYEGVNLQSTLLDFYASAANTPTAFNRHYTFDTRGNRTLVEQTDASSSSVFDISYSPDADTNVYNIVGGESYGYNDVEQMTYDPTRGVYMAYDYMGRLVAEDTTSEFGAPEKRYRYDIHSRLRVEETNYNPNEMTMFSCYAPNDPCGSGSCGGDQPEMSPMEHKFADSNDETI